jgi:hypothetical protein
MTQNTQNRSHTPTLADSEHSSRPQPDQFCDASVGPKATPQFMANRRYQRLLNKNQQSAAQARSGQARPLTKAL